MRQPLLRALAAVNGALLLAIFAAWHLEDPVAQHPAAAAAAPVPRAVAIEVAVPARETLRPMLERPLFALDRRPAESAPPAAAETPAAVEAMSLVGLAGSGDRGTAIVRYGGEIRRLRPGDKTGGWTLEGFEGDSARFRDEGSGASRVLPLVRAPQQAPATAHAPDNGTASAEALRAGPPADPMSAKSMEQRVAERRARREALEASRLR